MVTFAANFLPGPQAAGVAVSATGEVTVTAPLPAGARLLDFLVVATVTEAGNPNSPFTASKRFHIHGAITKTWLTPSQLTVRQGTGGMLFTILAAFDDGTYGDLSNWSPWRSPAAADRTFVHITGNNSSAVGWVGTAHGVVTVNADTGLLTGLLPAGNDSITAIVQPGGAALTATGTALGAPPWTTPVTLTLISGPGFAGMGTSRNILILPDGFQIGDQGAFNALSRDLVNKLCTQYRTRPYDLLKDKLNYFSGWVESREAGISPLPEIERSNVVGANADATEQDGSLAPPITIAAPPTPLTNKRFLLNERDTAFHAALGDRPQAQLVNPIRSGHVNPRRYDEQNFDTFYNNLADGTGNAVGGVWARGGQDQDRVLFLCRSNRTGGGNNYRSPTGRYIVMTLDRIGKHSIQDNGVAGKDLIPDPIPVDAGLEVWTTAAHELGHSFTLIDEYGGKGMMPASSLAIVNARANVDARSNLLTASSLDPSKIKWRWPRIAKAGALTAAPIASGGGKYRVQLEKGHAAAFAVGDVVRFRVRPLVGAPPACDRCKVMAVAGDELEILPLVVAPKVPFVAGNYPAGSVVLAPVRAPDPNRAADVYGDDVELVHKATLARMTATHNPLNAVRTDPADRPCTGAALGTPTLATNYPAGGIPNPPAYSSWIVGLYENGYGYDCGIYRPTGVCIMRTLHYSDTAVAGERSYQFCTVCRYAMVDLLDPSKHGAIDHNYAKRYPT
jgi:hypothetical protein